MEIVEYTRDIVSNILFDEEPEGDEESQTDNVETNVDPFGIPIVGTVVSGDPNSIGESQMIKVPVGKTEITNESEELGKPEKLILEIKKITVLISQYYDPILKACGQNNAELTKVNKEIVGCKCEIANIIGTGIGHVMKELIEEHIYFDFNGDEEREYVQVLNFMYQSFGITGETLKNANSNRVADKDSKISELCRVYPSSWFAKITTEK